MIDSIATMTNLSSWKSLAAAHQQGRQGGVVPVQDYIIKVGLYLGAVTKLSTATTTNDQFLIGAIEYWQDQLQNKESFYKKAKKNLHGSW